MGIDELKYEAAVELTRWQRHRFFVLIVVVIAISMLLVSVSMSLYNSSGAAQVDLSLPGYQSLQKQASQDRSDTTFSSTGALDQEAFTTFDSGYAAHLKRISGEAYESRPLSEDSLQLLSGSDPDTQSTN